MPYKLSVLAGALRQVHPQIGWWHSYQMHAFSVEVWRMEKRCYLRYALSIFINWAQWGEMSMADLFGDLIPIGIMFTPETFIYLKII